MAKERKLDINDLLSAINRGNYNWFSDLEDDAKKEFSPYVMVRYISNPTQYTELGIRMTNDLVNVHAQKFANHPEVQWKSAVAAMSTGQNLKYRFLPPGKRGKKDKLVEIVMSANPLWNETEAKIVLAQMDKKARKLLLLDLGYQDTDIKKLLK